MLETINTDYEITEIRNKRAEKYRETKQMCIEILKKKKEYATQFNKEEMEQYLDSYKAEKAVVRYLKEKENLETDGWMEDSAKRIVEICDKFKSGQALTEEEYEEIYTWFYDQFDLQITTRRTGLSTLIRTTFSRTEMPCIQ